MRYIWWTDWIVLNQNKLVCLIGKNLSFEIPVLVECFTYLISFSVLIRICIWTSRLSCRKQDGRWIQSTPSCSSISLVPAWSSECWSKNSIQREGFIHCDLSIYFPGMQSVTFVWHTLHNWCRSVLLDACYPCFKPWNCHGTWNHSNCDFWIGYATFSWVKDHWSWQQCSGGPSTSVSTIVQ